LCGLCSYDTERLQQGRIERILRAGERDGMTEIEVLDADTKGKKQNTDALLCS